MVQIENDVYSQIGLVMLIGLAAKNAILIVEFAKDEFEKGRPLVDAALEGARLRLRPILMTSFAFILGCVPLWTASGAGSVAPADHGHHGDRRHAGRQRHRHLPDPGDLLRGGEVVGRKATPARACRRCPRRRRETDMRHRSTRSSCCRGLAGRLHRGPELSAARRAGSRRPSARRTPLPPPQAASLADLKWFEVFKDEKLQELIRTALDAELRSARRCRARRSRRAPTSASPAPINFRNVGAGGSIRDQSPFAGRRDAAAGSVCAIAESQLGGRPSLNLLSFEIDIWGRLRRATEAARANLLSAEENRKAVVTTLVSDVATSLLQPCANSTINWRSPDARSRRARNRCV